MHGSQERQEEMGRWPEQGRGGALGVFPVLLSPDFGAGLPGFPALLPEAKTVFYRNLFFKNRAFASQAKPLADRKSTRMDGWEERLGPCGFMSSQS